MLGDKIYVEVVMPTVTTQNALTKDLKDFGLSSQQIAAAKARIVNKRAAAGTGKAIDDSVAITGDNLVIAEGATGFVTGDVFGVMLFIGALDSGAGTASTV
jgi:hypothetical protein